MVLVDCSAEHLSALDPAFQRHHNLLVLIRWALPAGLVQIQQTNQHRPRSCPHGAWTSKPQIKHYAMSYEAVQAPRRAVPIPIAEPARIIDLNIRRRDRLGGILHEYSHAA